MSTKKKPECRFTSPFGCYEREAPSLIAAALGDYLCKWVEEKEDPMKIIDMQLECGIRLALENSADGVKIVRTDEDGSVKTIFLLQEEVEFLEKFLSNRTKS